MSRYFRGVFGDPTADCSTLNHGVLNALGGFEGLVDFCGWQKVDGVVQACVLFKTLGECGAAHSSGLRGLWGVGWQRIAGSQHDETDQGSKEADQAFQKGIPAFAGWMEGMVAVERSVGMNGSTLAHRRGLGQFSLSEFKSSAVAIPLISLGNRRKSSSRVARKASSASSSGAAAGSGKGQ